MLDTRRRHSAPLCTCNVYAVHTLSSLSRLVGFPGDVVCRAAFHSQIENLGHLRTGDHFMFISVPLQSQSGIIITLGVYMSEGASRWVLIAPQTVVSITSLTLVLSIPQIFVVRGPYDSQGRHFPTAHLQRVFTGMRLLYCHVPSLNDVNTAAFREILWQSWTTVINLVQGHTAIPSPHFLYVRPF